jgi:hypothetical protein
VEENWRSLDLALRHGYRDLEGRSSLAKLLAEHRGVRNTGQLPRLSQQQILGWADAHFARTGQWPRRCSGLVPESPGTGDTWMHIDQALKQGQRGLPGGSSLAALLVKHRGLRSHVHLPPLTIRQILAWADAYHDQQGHWPGAASGPVLLPEGESWGNINAMLQNGGRGLAGRSSLADLLARERGRRNPGRLPALSIPQILAWADAHHARTGHWPTIKAGAIPEAAGETWAGVRQALAKGLRGLAGGTSLARLLQQERGVRNRKDLPRLTKAQVVAWAREHHQRTGRWPTDDSGPVVEAPGETWCGIEQALYKGHRGLSGGSSLARLLGREKQRS